MRQNLIGQKYERLAVVSFAGKSKSSHLLWLCRCDCGNERIVEGGNLRRGNTKSCGCLKLQIMTERFTTHGGRGTLGYTSYIDAKRRCTNPNTKNFHHYGGRGIKFLFNGFEEFFADVGPRPGKEYSLDRINNEGNYEPGNCRWATIKIQSRNKRTNRNLTYQNETLCLKSWAERLGLNHKTISKRLDYGWSVEKALSTPIRARA